MVRLGWWDFTLSLSNSPDLLNQGKVIASYKLTKSGNNNQWTEVNNKCEVQHVTADKTC